VTSRESYATAFPPAVISTRVNETVVSQHSEETAFLWSMRNRAVDEPHYSLKDLTRLDERVEANLCGLRFAGEVGWRFSVDNFALGEGPGELFALAALAFDGGHYEHMSHALKLAVSSAKLTTAMESALGWLRFNVISKWVDRLLKSKVSAHRAIGIAACAVHRTDPGLPLAAALADSDPALRARALRAAGEIRRDDLRDVVLECIRDDDAECRFWASWSATLLGEPNGLRYLRERVEQNDQFGTRSLRLCVRALPASESRHLLSSLAGQKTHLPLAIAGIGMLGDPVSIPWLIAQMSSVEFARLAGESFSLITGADLGYLHLDEAISVPLDVTANIDEDGHQPSEYQSNLPKPSVPRVADWWHANQEQFAAGTRHLAGKPVAKSSAIDVLINGKQRQRHAAAIELALLDPILPLFNVRDRATSQHRKLLTLT
jgi:uncharacterized protein (TIGR02270 family)